MIKIPVDLAALNRRCQNSLIEHLGIEFIEAGANFLTAKMPVDARTRQPLGILHGGASAALAETLGSVAATLCLDPARQYPVGLDINANHLRPVETGFVTGTARPVHLGRKTHVWQIKISNEAGQLVCVSRLTLMIMDRE
jgi:1,4-dihydroxy-2-naphthoyl-CoA hydrolase